MNPISVKALQRYLEFVNFYRSYFPRLADKTAVLHELIRKHTIFKIEQRHKDEIFDITESLLEATKLSLKLPLPDNQLVIICDASEHAAGGAKKPIIVMTDKKALTRFFQAKHIPPSLRNFCDQTPQFNFILAHVPGVENPAADYLSRLEIRPEERVHLKLTDSIPVLYI